MEFKQLLLLSLRKPADLPDLLSSFKLKLNTIIEGAIFIAAITSLLNSLLDRLIFKSSENASRLLENNSLSFIFNPLSMFAFELIFIITVMLSILFFSNFSKQKVSIEELGKNVLVLFFVAFVFKFTKLYFYLFRLIYIIFLDFLKCYGLFGHCLLS